MKLSQGTGFALMPRGLTAEVAMDRVEWWRATHGPDGMLWTKETRIRLEGGPFDGWAWDVSLIPDRFLVEGGGEYRPWLGHEDTFAWVPPGEASE